MHKNLIYVLVSFLSVALIISIGINIAYRTSIITNLKSDFQKKEDDEAQKMILKNEQITKLNEELEIAHKKQVDAENKLKEKLAEEDRIRLEEEQHIKDAQIAAEKKALEQKAAEEARLATEAAAKKKKSSKKSKAS